MHRVSKPKVNWTPEMDAEVLAARRDGVHSSEVAQSLGLSVAAVDARYFRLKRIMNGGKP